MAKEKINFMQMIVPKKYKNTDNRGNNADREFNTTDSVRLLSWDEMADRTNEERRKSNTDFALCNFAWQNSSYTAENDKITGAFWSRSAYYDYNVSYVNYAGSRYYTTVNNSLPWLRSRFVPQSSIFNLRAKRVGERNF